MEIKEKVPDGWQIKTLSEVCSPSSSNIAFKDVKDKKGDYPIYGASGIVAYSDFYSKEKECIGIVKDGSVGKIFLLPAKSSVISTLNYLENFDNLDIKYLYYFLHCINFGQYVKGSVIPHIYFRDYKKEKIPLPPLAIQKQIAEKLDYLFDKIDKALTFLKENKEYIKKYRLSILKYAFDGKLTPSFKNWETKTLGEVCEKISAGGDRPNDCTPEKTEENQIPIFSNGVENNGLYGYTKTPTITKPALTVSARGTIGFTCVRYEPFFPIVRLICAIPNDKILYLEFLFYTLKYLIPQGEGSTIPQLTIPNFKQIKIPIPNIETQKEIVSILDKKFKAMDEIERLNNENIENLLLLKKSLLKEAFSGKLI